MLNNFLLIYLDKAKDKIVLHASLEMDGGDVCIQIVSMQDNSVFGEGNYSKPDSFNILLENIPADSEYTFQIKTTDTNKIKLSVTSTEDFGKDKPKPVKKAK